MTKYQIFLSLAQGMNRELGMTPLLYGSLGLEQRLRTDLQADDIDILVPEIWLRSDWSRLAAFMEQRGYLLYDLHEHAFRRDAVSVAFAPLEDLGPFAGVDIRTIPVETENGAEFLLLDLEDYRKVYTASACDGYRKNKKNKDDTAKIRLIEAWQSRSSGQGTTAQE